MLGMSISEGAVGFDKSFAIARVEMIGNEIDIYLGNSDKAWREYTEFYNAVAPFVRNKFPRAIVSGKITFDGFMNLRDHVQGVLNNSNGVLVTYYPFKPGSFDVRDPSTAREDFNKITAFYPDKKIYFAEIGYPSGGGNRSSEEKQAAFVREAFLAWDNHHDQIPILSFDWLHDKSSGEVSEFERYYGSSDRGFSSYLGTLGLRTYNGKDKQAFVELRKATKSRGW